MDTTQRTFPATLKCKVDYGENGDQALFFKAIDDASRRALADLCGRLRRGNAGVRVTYLKQDSMMDVEEALLVIPRV